MLFPLGKGFFGGAGILGEGKRRAFLVLGLLAFLCLFYVSFAQTKEECLGCHEGAEQTRSKTGTTVKPVDPKLLNNSPHGKLECVACHLGFDPNNVPHKAKMEPVNCLNCHKKAPTQHIYHNDFIPQGVPNAQIIAECKKCHGTHDMSTHLLTSCKECHEETVGQFVKSDHGKALKGKVSAAPNCISCHRKEIIQPVAGANGAGPKIAQEKACLSCHLDNPKVNARVQTGAGFIGSYEKSVHGAALLRGNEKAANCVDCHGSHDIENGLSSTSSVSKAKVPETCGKCHAEQAAQYRESIHGIAASKGNPDSPVCTNCHGEHSILPPSDPRSPVAPANVAQVCSSCHSSVRLSQRYGFPSDRFKTFNDSFHGLAMRGGNIKVANCASCHGVHNIKPSSDPTSTVNKVNLAKTCGKCHPGANEQFTMGAVHLTLTPRQQPILYWIGIAYILLITATIGGMLVHNVLDFRRKSHRTFQIRTGEIEEKLSGRGIFLRMTVNERIQHLLLTISFIVLAGTGFMLRYPDAWWITHLRSVYDQVFELRSFIHRGAAITLVVTALYHLFYIAFTKRGRQFIKDMFPRIKDAWDVIGMFKLNLGLSKDKPQLDRFSYVEKSEYWALIWGTVVMTITGILMMYENVFIRLFTKQGYDIARTFHFYEAWLAVLAILVWHLYFVIFNPDVYPMNFAWITGNLTEEEMEEEHPLELERIREEQTKNSDKTEGSS